MNADNDLFDAVEPSSRAATSVGFAVPAANGVDDSPQERDDMYAGLDEAVASVDAAASGSARASKRAERKARKQRERDMKDWEKHTFAAALDVPRSGMPGMKTVRVTTAMLRWGTLVVACALLMLAFGLVRLALNPAPAAVSSDAANANVTSPGRAIATQHVNSWLGGDYPPVNGGVIVSWDGVVSSVRPNVQSTSTATVPADYVMEVDAFTISDTSGALYSSQVQVMVSDSGGAKVIGEPSLVPVVAAPQELSAESVWPGLDVGQAPQGVDAAVKSWLSAYLSGDAAALKLTVGDPNRDASYVPMAAVQEAWASVQAAAVPGPRGHVIVRLKVWVVPRVTPAVAGEELPPVPVTMGSSGSEGSASFLVEALVADADTGSPRVVAWGGTGSGPDLTPYENAYPSVDRAPDVPAAPSASSSDAAASSAASSAAPSSDGDPAATDASTQPAQPSE